MTSSLLTTVFLPAALAVIMFGLGLSLTLADFRRVLVFPKAVVVALVCQTLLLPFACFAVAKGFGLAPALAVGLMLLAASPGGTAANLYSHLAHGDVALNVTLTAVNSALALLTLPVIVNLSLTHFYGEGKVIPLQFGKVLQVFLVVLVPVAVGMTVRARRTAFALRMARPVKILSILFLALIVLLALMKDSGTLGANFGAIGGAALTFNLLSLGVGYGVPRLLRLSQRQSVAIGMEIGIHNGTLAIAIALSPLMLDNPAMAIPAAIYSGWMFATAALFGWWASKKTAREAGETGPENS
jgi:bile acid:Na+ symporter, BASS family